MHQVLHPRSNSGLIEETLLALSTAQQKPSLLNRYFYVRLRAPSFFLYQDVKRPESTWRSSFFEKKYHI